MALRICFLLCLLPGLSSHAADLDTSTETNKSPWSATVDVTSNYIWQGISQTNNRPALQGGATYTFANIGFYADVWASNVQFGDGYGHTAHLELDTSFGATNTFGNFTYDIEMARYNYPHTERTSFNELVANFQYYFITTMFGYSNDVYASGYQGVRYNLGVDYDIPENWFFHIHNMNISGGMGHYTLPRAAGLQSFNDVRIELTKTIGNYELSLAWTDASGVGSEDRGTGGSMFAATLLVNIG